MALTTGSAGDISGCIEATVGYFGLNNFNSGRYGISFDFTGDDERIIGKDPTSVGAGNALYIDYVQLATCGTGAVGQVALCDGSGGVPFITLTAHDGTLTSGNVGVWDFKDDPLVCLTADNTQSVCISSAASAQTSGFIKCYWGPNL